MIGLNRRDPEDLVVRLALCAAGLIVATVVAAGLQAWLGIADASAIYLLAVVPKVATFWRELPSRRSSSWIS